MKQSTRTLFACSLQKHFMGLICFHLIPLIVWSMGAQICLITDVMCHDCFVHSWTSHSSHIHFRVCIVSCDMIEHGVTWKRILLHLHGIHIHMGLMFTHDSLNHGFT